jgi:Polyprenyltransferase (cytochrome oxidase assembly factor)
VTRRDFAQLFKLPISIMSTMSAATGFVAFTHALTWRLVPTSGAILLLAFAACALNQAQEYKRDAMMDRTRLRPIPSGKISPTSVVAWSTILALVALLALFLLGGAVAAGLGALAVLWYNGIYTYLKRVSSLAPVIGSVIGAIPPAIGWVCAGGVLDGPILSLSFFLLMWQVPHFWLLALRTSGDYEQAHFPTFVRVLGAGSLSRVTFMWTAATAASALLLPIFGLSNSPFLGLGLAAAGAWLTLVAWRALRAPGQQGFRQAFLAINYYAVMVMGAVILDAMLGGP